MAEVVKLQGAEPEEKPAFCRTPTAARILAALDYCHQFEDMGVIVGEPGVGKTTAFRHYTDGAPHTWLVTGTSSIRALVPFLAAVAETIVRYHPNTGAYDIRRIITQGLAVVSAPALLIVDEAQHLQDAAIEELRSMHDEIGIGVVLAGRRDLPARWSDGGARGRPWAQLVSRIGPQLDFAGARADDVNALCDHYEITDRGARPLLRKASEGAGALRNVVKTIAVARQLAGDGQPVKREHVEQALSLRGGSM